MNDKRQVNTIAREILNHWKKPYFGAMPYLQAMLNLHTVNDMYMYDDGKSIVRYFLANASTFKGEDAKRLKLELKSMLKG
jgi:hypothetical protein